MFLPARSFVTARRKLDAGGFSLEHFIQKSRVIALYRKALRSTRNIPHSDARTETVAWLRSDIERHRFETDIDKIKALIAAGHRDLKAMLPPGAALVGVPTEDGYHSFWKRRKSGGA